MKPEHAEAMKAMIELAVRSNASTSIVLGRDLKNKIVRVAVVCDGDDARKLAKLLRQEGMLEE